MDKLCPLWNLYAFSIISRLWLEFPEYRSCIEEKPDYHAYLLALNQLHWITLGVSGGSNKDLLMEEFASNLKLFVSRPTMYHDVDLKFWRPH
jgi:hypothetical protein